MGEKKNHGSMNNILKNRLITSIKHGNLDLVNYYYECLHNEKININEVMDDKRNTVLHLSIISGNPEIVEFLANKEDVDINAVNDDGNTALHILAQKNEFSNKDLEIAKILFSREDIKLDLKNKKGYTPEYCLNFCTYKYDNNCIAMTKIFKDRSLKLADESLEEYLSAMNVDYSSYSYYENEEEYDYEEYDYEENKNEYYEDKNLLENYSIEEGRMGRHAGFLLNGRVSSRMLSSKPKITVPNENKSKNVRILERIGKNLSVKKPEMPNLNPNKARVIGTRKIGTSHVDIKKEIIAEGRPKTSVDRLSKSSHSKSSRGSYKGV